MYFLRHSPLTLYPSSSLNCKFSVLFVLIKPLFLQDDAKEAEIVFATAIACSTSIKAADTLGEVNVRYGNGSVWARTKVHRTKCKYIVKNIVAQCFKEDLKAELQGRKFSVMVDESTDISTTKLMAIALRYYSPSLGKVVDEYLGIVEVVYTTGEILWQKLKAGHYKIFVFNKQ